MTYRKFTDLPRLSGRPGGAGAPPSKPEPGHVFRRFFDLIERLERPGSTGPQPPRPPRGQSGPRGR